MNLLIFGAGYNGKLYYEQIKNSNVSVLAFVDNHSTEKSLTSDSVPVVVPHDIAKYQFDEIIVTIADEKIVEDVAAQLKQLGVDRKKIKFLNDMYFNPYNEDADFRVAWLRNFAEYVYERNILGNVAECGVYRGEFAEYINKYFADRKLYLFDTFEGFLETDKRANLGINDGIYEKSKFATDSNMYASTSAARVLSRMPNPQNCIIKEGWFPESAIDVRDTFCFVNLDMDLYQPILAGLSFFWDKMVCGGVILIHDYFHSELKAGVQKALVDFEMRIKSKICKIPIGDYSSIALIKV